MACNPVKYTDTVYTAKNNFLEEKKVVTVSPFSLLTAHCYVLCAPSTST